MGSFQKKNLGVSPKNLKNLREFDAWSSPDPKPPKILISVVVTVWRNKFYKCPPMLESLFNKVAGFQACNFTKKRLQHKCRISVNSLLLGRLNKFLLVINLTRNVFFWILWISESWNKLLTLNIVRGLSIIPLGMLRNRD